MYFGPNQRLLFVIYLQGTGPGISVPFNVQHVAHIGADNVEALLQAAPPYYKLKESWSISTISESILPTTHTQEGVKYFVLFFFLNKPLLLLYYR